MHYIGDYYLFKDLSCNLKILFNVTYDEAMLMYDKMETVVGYFKIRVLSLN